jgi:hypothetical protein
VTEFFTTNGVVVPPPVSVDDPSVIKITALQSATRRDQHAARYLGTLILSIFDPLLFTFFVFVRRILDTAKGEGGQSGGSGDPSRELVGRPRRSASWWPGPEAFIWSCRQTFRLCMYAVPFFLFLFVFYFICLLFLFVFLFYLFFYFYFYLFFIFNLTFLVLVLGTMHEIDGPKVYVTAVLMNPDGSILGSYRKRKPTIEGAVRIVFHLFLFLFCIFILYFFLYFFLYLLLYLYLYSFIFVYSMMLGHK